MDVESEIRAWLDTNIIGAKALDEDGKREVAEFIQQHIADRVGCERSEVLFVNPHWEGTEFVADGYTYPLTNLNIKFTINTDDYCETCGMIYYNCLCSHDS